MEARELDYDLPRELIAQRPVPRRDRSRLLVYRRSTGEVAHHVFHELPDLVDGLAVVNDTKVVPARIPIERPRGEVLLLEQVDGEVWEALARPTRKLRVGDRHGPVELLEHLGEGRWLVRLEGDPHGDVPLPPYITEPLADDERYQTVYARERGSAAAPTAGLHFTPEVLGRLDVERVTLARGSRHVPAVAGGARRGASHPRRALLGRAAGLGADPRGRAGARGRHDHRARPRDASPPARRSPGAPSSSSRRASRSAASTGSLTNFHLPRSTLLALVMAFAGVEETRRLYALAIEERYRFYSFGDAMLIL